MGNLYLGTTSLDWSLFQQTAIIERRNQTGINNIGEPVFDDASPLLVYSGPADVQSLQGVIEETPEGYTEFQEYEVFIDPDPTYGTLPEIHAGDRLTYTAGTTSLTLTFMVEKVAYWTDVPPHHVELLCKQGLDW